MKVIVNNIAAEYTDEGKGPVLLFLPGWMNTLSNFDELASRLVSNYRIVRLDLPGFGGGTETPPLNWHIADYASFVKAFIEKIRLDSYTLVGHSFGGRVVIKGVAQEMLRPSRIILIAPGGVAKHRTFRNQMLTVLAKIGKVFLYIPPFVFWRTQLRRKLYKMLKSDYFAAGALSRVYLNAIREDLQEDARKIQIPTLLVWGTDDEMVPLSDGRRFAELIKNSKLEIISGVGHSIHRERADEVARFIRTFLTP